MGGSGAAQHPRGPCMRLGKDIRAHCGAAERRPRRDAHEKALGVRAVGLQTPPLQVVQSGSSDGCTRTLDRLVRWYA